jgi:7,8-dihydropterin-6-yl-methyl-4-(beta-D-ribofuranosyl)aminobenzene 5'-phosphate synthase
MFLPPPIQLPAVDGARVTVIMDNSFDMLMADVAIATRVALGPNPFERPQPIAEHGFSVLIEVWQGDKRGTVLFDTGVSRTGILRNMDVLEIQAADIQAVILSHGHADHAMGLPGLIDRLGTRSAASAAPRRIPGTQTCAAQWKRNPHSTSEAFRPAPGEHRGH